MYESVTVIIPSRNEPYLKNTIEDLLSKAGGRVEIYAILDGAWIAPEDIVDDVHVNYVHFSEARGMRNAINTGAKLARGSFLLKTDAHCLFSDCWDTKLIEGYEENTVVVPRRYALDVKKWAIEERHDTKYPIDYMYLSHDLHGVVWDEKNHDPKLKEKLIDETPSNQGSVWFMKKDYFNYLELMDESKYGMFWNEFQEIGFKVWLSGGKVMVNKNAYYAHWHKVGSRGYNLPPDEKERALKALETWKNGEGWSKQIHPLKWFWQRFPDMPNL
jgi:glycosyltransferase involved in cell wall biosynthesis